MISSKPIYLPKKNERNTPFAFAYSQISPVQTPHFSHVSFSMN